MPRTFTSLDVRSEPPDRLRGAFEAWASGRDAAWERGDPAGDEPGRLRWDAAGTHHGALGDGLTDGTLAPHDWAVVTWTMDEAVGVNAWVYADGAELDRYEGVEGWQGADTEAYLERFHGVRVDRAGPYATSRPYRPSVHLAVLDPPARTLADDPPAPPFAVTDDPAWLLVEGAVDDPAAFTGWFRERLRGAGFRFAAPFDRLDRAWAGGPTDVTREPPTEDAPGRVRVRVPLTGDAVTDEGLNLPFGLGRDRADAADACPCPASWLVFVVGDDRTERAEAYVYVDNDRRFTFEDGTDAVRGDAGRRGADVAAYLRRFYGWAVDPTPADRALPPRTDDPPADARPPGEWAVRAVRDAGLDPGPGMPDPDT